MAETSSGKFKSFNTTNYVCIEYPGYVKTVEGMLKTLGGEEQLSDTYFNTKRRVELHFRPSDPYCHSVCGDLQPSRSLLLKVKRRRKKRQSNNETENEWKYEQEVLGIVQNTYRFVSLMDFQYVTPEPLQNAFATVMTSSLLDEQQPLHIMPPIFARIDVHGNYNYHPEVVNRLGTKGNPVNRGLQDIEEETPQQHSDTRIRKRRPSDAMGAIFSSNEVPREPGKKCREVVDAIGKKFSWVQEALEELIELFKERPIWSRTAINYHLRKSVKNERLKQLLPFVAFYWLNGPWRALWNRFGYDPRKQPDAKRYQICDFRVRRKDAKDMPILPLRSSRICILPHQIQRSKGIAAVSVDHEEPDPERPHLAPEELPYTFHAEKLPGARQIMYQLCDIYDDDIKAVISENDGKEKKCTEKHGWFGPNVINKMRDLLSKKVELRIEKELKDKDQKERDACELEADKSNDANAAESFTQHAENDSNEDDIEFEESENENT